MHRWQGSWGQQTQECDPKGHEAHTSPGACSEAPGRSSGAGHQQHPKRENQDSQHKLNQPRRDKRSRKKKKLKKQRKKEENIWIEITRRG